MRYVLYAAGAVALALLSSPDSIACALAATASALFEATPFLVAAILISAIMPRAAIVDYLGCGCAEGPSARSVPAAAATWLLFGPAVAVARFVAAVIVDRLLRRHSERRATLPTASNVLHELAALLPAAMLAGAAVQLATTLVLDHLSAPAGAALGALLGFTAAPCGLGAVAVAGALRVRSPIAAAAFLCIAGIADLRALRSRSHCITEHDAFGYVLLAVALGIVAWRHGGALVHPSFAAAIACCAIVAAACAFAHRRRRSPTARIAPAFMLFGALIGAPPPQYHATETTLSDAFAGERITFTGVLARNGDVASIVRYAITCCRADAAPVALRLDRIPSYTGGTWLRVAGTMENATGELRLRPASVERIQPPPDPFIYR